MCNTTLTQFHLLYHILKRLASFTRRDRPLLV
jgi:hypothetical protein